MTHPILTDHPAYIAHRHKVADLEDARGKWRNRKRAAGDEYQALLTEYRRAAKALLRGDEPPPEPARPQVGTPEEARRFLDESQRLRDEERRLLADLAEEIEDAGAVREGQLLAEARPLIVQLETMAAEFADLLDTVRDVRRAWERLRTAVAPGYRVSDRMPRGVTALDLVAAVVDDLPLLDPTPTAIVKRRAP